MMMPGMSGLDLIKLLRRFSGEVAVKEIAVRTDRTPHAVYKAFKRIRQRLDTRTNRELRNAAKGLGLLGSKETPR